jgi:osmotically-inducible protein OsmY
MSLPTHPHAELAAMITPPPRPVDTDDLALQITIQAAMSWEPGLDGASIRVMAKDGKIFLDGTVETLMDKFAAYATASRVPGVKSVVSSLRVLLPSAGHADDDKILEMARATLAWDISLSPHKLAVDIDRGWVTLSGEVSREYQRETAEQDIARLQGVLGVSNNISIKPTVNVLKMTDAIMRALHRHWSFDPKSVQVSAEGGKIRLSGEVRSQHEKDLVSATAWRAPGATSVQNDLTIG